MNRWSWPRKSLISFLNLPSEFANKRCRLQTLDTSGYKTEIQASKCA